MTTVTGRTRTDQRAQDVATPARPLPDRVSTSSINLTMAALQRGAGNAAVSALLSSGATGSAVQRLVWGGVLSAPPVSPGPAVPLDHPGFRAASGSVKAAATATKRHPPAASKAREAARSAEPPVDGKEAEAKAAKAATMGAAPTSGFDKAAFVAAVKAAIEKQTPKTLDDAASFATSGKSDAVAAEVRWKVGQGRDASAKPLAEASARQPDTAAATEKAVTPLPPGAPPPRVAVDGRSAMPPPAPADQTELGHGPAETGQKMAAAGVTEQQLANSNEPEFVGALAAKKEGEEHSTTAPAALRQAEQQKLAQSRQGAGAMGAQGVSALLAGRDVRTKGVASKQQLAKAAEEKKRADVATNTRSMFDATKVEVDAILTGIDGLVEKEFTRGEAEAKKAFTEYHKSEMERFRDREYSGPLGWGRWTADLFAGSPPEVDAIFRRARARYEQQMTAVIGQVADIVGRELTRAKDRVARGRTQIATYINGLEPSLRVVGADAAKQIGGEFDSLEESVDEKSQSLVDDLAERYVSARSAVDDEIKAMQEENEGLWDKAKDAVGGAIETIMKLKDMLTGVLARAAGAVGKIIADPIAFLGNFVNAVKSGIQSFGSNILSHLTDALQSWLFGALAAGGIEVPKTFDSKGILQMVLSILGLTWAKVRVRIAAKVPPGAIEKIEQGFAIVKIIATEGLGGIWNWIVEKIGDIKETIMIQVKEMVSVEIIKAGIVWLISLLNPASAFVKACKMIYDVVMFFVEKADQIKEFVDSVLDSVESIAAGGVGAVASHIERTLAKMLPVLIGFLASLLGLGNIPNKIKKILAVIQKPINAAIDWVIGKAVAFGKRALRFGKKLWGKAKAKGKELIGNAKKKLGIKEKTPEEIEKEKQKRLDKGVAAGVRAVDKLAGRPILGTVLSTVLAVIRIRYRMTTLEAVQQGDVWAVHGVVNPADTKPTKAKVKKGEEDKWVGNVAPHNAQPSPRPGLWSEHVIPRGYVDSFLRAHGYKGTNRSEYNSMHTVLTYRDARKGKDFGPNADLSLISRFKSRTVTGKTEGRVGAGDSPENAAKAFRMLSKGAVNRTVAAVLKEYNDNKAARAAATGLEAPVKPDASTVSNAAEQELVVIESIISSRRG